MYVNRIKCSGAKCYFTILTSNDFLNALFTLSKAISYQIYFIQAFWKYTFFKIQTFIFASDIQLYTL
jgi:hypothetical protein